AIIIDLAPVPVAPSSQYDIAPGPTMQESQTPPPGPQVEPEKTEPPPPVQSQVVLSEPKPKVEPKPERKPPAPRTTAAPRNLLNPASIPAAPGPGSSAQNFPPNWISLLFSHLLRYRQYPSSAQSARQEGVVTVNFTMDRSGRVLSRHIVHG